MRSSPGTALAALPEAPGLPPHPVERAVTLASRKLPALPSMGTCGATSHNPALPLSDTRQNRKESCTSPDPSHHHLPPSPRLQDQLLAHVQPQLSAQLEDTGLTDRHTPLPRAPASGTWTASELLTGLGRRRGKARNWQKGNTEDSEETVKGERLKRGDSN